MTTVTIHEAKTHLSRLIREALAGGEVTITQGRSGEELVKLVPAKPVIKPRPVPGWLAHQRPPGSKGILENGFWDPLSDEEMGLGHDPLLDKRDPTS
ncbi:MAG: type II toxin-antitoxin system prevent-host-death family antitoxin [Novosphingobium sp.]|nr:type II toxin-antitoxin system prevent-host-death family antitoxin [Novosphingobium sp.]